MAAAVGQRVALRVRELDEGGAAALRALPEAAALSARSASKRHEVLEDLRVELYAVAALVADATVRRAYSARADHPPYGLVRSMQSDVRLMGTASTVVEAGAVEDFYLLGKMWVETVVFHLHQELGEAAGPERAWMGRHLEDLLSLFAADAAPAARARMRDPISFIYGGLHFGAGVSVQLVEVMCRLLAEFPDLDLDARAEILARSSRPAYQLATMNLDHVVAAYQGLQGPQQPSTTPGGRLSLVSWMDEKRFVVSPADGRAWKIELADEAFLRRPSGGSRVGGRGTTWATHGCPARIPPAGGPSAIATLWTWCVQLARDTGLLVPSPGKEA